MPVENVKRNKTNKKLFYIQNVQKYKDSQYISKKIDYINNSVECKQYLFKLSHQLFVLQ